MTSKLNRCYWTAASAGTGSFVYSATVPKHLSPANAEAVDGATYAVIAENDADSEWEISIGVYDSDTGTITRDTIVESSNGGAVVDFTAAPKVRMGVPLAADFPVETIASVDLGATPAASFSFDLDITQFATMRIIWHMVRVDTDGFTEGDVVNGVYMTVRDSSANILLNEISIGNFIYVEWGVGYSQELVPINFEMAIVSAGRSLNIESVGSQYYEDYIDGALDGINTMTAGGGDKWASPLETELTLEFKPLLNGSDPINFIAGTVTVIGTRK